MTDSRLAALIGAPEELDPELAECMTETRMFGMSIKHPLVFSIPHFPPLNGHLNRVLAQKRKMLDEATEAEDWHTYVFLHERPYRAEAFADIADQMDDAAYWDLLAIVWMESENIPQMQDVWDTLLADDRPGRENMMDDEERAALAALPDVVTVYQGHTTARDDGWSWTTDRTMAAWFARRFAELEDSEPVVTTGHVRREDITAYLLGRHEHEVLVDPDLVISR
jgi:hypothetical protein